DADANRPRAARRARNFGRRRGHRRYAFVASRRGPDPNAGLTHHLANTIDKQEERKAMAELTISADDIQGAIEEYVSSFTSDTAREEVGTVINTGDGIAHIEGLPSVMTQELLEFPGGVLGVA